MASEYPDPRSDSTGQGRTLVALSLKVGMGMFFESSSRSGTASCQELNTA